MIAAHGIKGAVKVFSYAESPDRFQPGLRVWIQPLQTDFDTLEISWAQPHHRGILVKFSTTSTRNEAERLRGLELFIERAQLPELEEDSYYWFDLIGLKVKTASGSLIGRLDAVLPTGGNDVYVVKPIDGKEGKECLIPAVAEFIHKIDLNNKVMVVNLPEGL